MPRQRIALPLRTLREKSGFADIVQALECLNGHLPTPLTVDGLKMIEYRGTRNIDILKALAFTYDVPLSIVSDIARPEQKNISNCC